MQPIRAYDVAIDTFGRLAFPTSQIELASRLGGRRFQCDAGVQCS
jgi:hypothetical protein